MSPMMLVDKAGQAYDESNPLLFAPAIGGVTKTQVPVNQASAVICGTLVPGVAGEVIYVVGGILTAGGTTNVIFESIGTASTVNISGTMNFLAGGMMVLPPVTPRDWHFKTAAGQSLGIRATAATVNGLITYFQE